MPHRETLLRRLRLRDLHMLAVLAEMRSMASAAERLAISQPAISKAVAEMEQLLGAPLLDRSPRGVELTAFGEVLLARGAVVFDELRQAIEEIRSLSDPGQGHLRIGATEPMSAVVAEIIAAMSRRYPRMSFETDIDGTGGLLSGLRNRRLDAAITRMATGPEEADLDAEPLFHDPLVVMAGERHPLVQRQTLALADLLGERWTLSPPDMFLGRFVTEAFRNRGLEPPHPTVTAVSVVMRVGLLRTGEFLGILPNVVLHFPQHYPGLRGLPVDLSDTRRPVALVTVPGRRPAPALRLFREYALRTASTAVRL